VKQFIAFIFSWGEDSTIANFVPNFVAMVTGSVGENAIAAFDGPSPKTPLWAQKISPKSLTQAKL